MRKEEIEISVIIPAHDEEAGIGAILDELREVMTEVGTGYEIIVVDDGSTDNTPEIVKQRKGIALFHHPYRRGYGAALKTGIRNAKGDRVLITDADGTYPPKEIPKLLEHTGNYDMVVGARTGENVAIPLYRRPAKRLFTRFAEYLSETKIPDLNSGLRVFRKDIVTKFLRILPSGFSFTTTITLAFSSEDYSIKYVPIDYHLRKGKSKISPLKDGMNIILSIVRIITYFNPLKVFLPISILLFLSGAGVFFYSATFLDRILDTTVAILVVTSIQVGVIALLADLIVRRAKSPS